MLSQKQKKFINTFATLAIAVTITAPGGIVNAQQNTFNTQNYQYPPADAVPQINTKAVPAFKPVAKPAVRIIQDYSRPYPVQRQTSPYPVQRPMSPYPAQRPMPSYPAQRPMPSYPAHGPMPSYPAQRPMPPRAPDYASAASQRPSSVPIQAPFANPMSSGPGVSPYRRSYNNGPAYANPYAQGPYNRAPYNPYNRGPYNNRGSYSKGPFKNFGGGPFNGNSAPWESWPFGSRDSFWNRKEFPFKKQNPTDWFTPGDPKEGAAIMWDDLIAAPDDLGTMPGGWNVPSISVPNPVDLEDQLEKASKEVPDLIRVYND